MNYRANIREVAEAEIHRKTRRSMIHRFPFGIYYRIKGELVIVVAVMHGSRNPKLWRESIIRQIL